MSSEIESWATNGVDDLAGAVVHSSTGPPYCRKGPSSRAPEQCNDLSPPHQHLPQAGTGAE